MTLNIFEDVSANVVKGLHIVKKASSNILEYGFLQSDKVRFMEQRKELLCELGTLLYDMMLKDSLELEPLQQKCEQIMELDEQLCTVAQEEEKVAPDCFGAHIEINVRDHGASVAYSATGEQGAQAEQAEQEQETADNAEADMDADEETEEYEANDID